MPILYPLKFEPYPQYLRFGGKFLYSRIDKEADKKKLLAETWEISGHKNHSSVVKNGHLSGASLANILKKFGQELVGDWYNYKDGDIFPLMLRFLDCQENLPPAVHPDDKYLQDNGIIESGKTEAWYVINSNNDSVVYCGNKTSLSLNNVKDISEKGEIFEHINTYRSKQGDVFLVHPGCIHSIGKGNLIYEIQRTSNVIFPFDWLKWDDKNVKRRESDLKKSIDVLKLNNHTNYKIKPVKIKDNNNNREILVISKYFALEKYTLNIEEKVSFEPPTFSIVTVLRGEILITHDYKTDNKSIILEKLESALIPSVISEYVMTPSKKSEVLIAYIPDIESVYNHLLSLNISEEDIINLGGSKDGNPFVLINKNS